MFGIPFDDEHYRRAQTFQQVLAEQVDHALSVRREQIERLLMEATLRQHPDDLDRIHVVEQHIGGLTGHWTFGVASVWDWKEYRRWLPR